MKLKNLLDGDVLEVLFVWELDHNLAPDGLEEATLSSLHKRGIEGMRRMGSRGIKEKLLGDLLHGLFN